MNDNKKTLLYIFMVGWFGSLIWIGKPYLGSVWGNTIFISSSLFLAIFVLLNSLKVEEIKQRTINNIQNIDILLILYFITVVSLIIVGSLKPPSLFLISLFFIYLILTISWIFIFENKMFTKYSSLLLLLTLIPLCIGLISSEMENEIENSIGDLSHQVDYYEDNLDNITNGILTKNHADDIRHYIQSLKNYLDSANKAYLSGDLISSKEKIKDAEETNRKLENYFDLLDPKKALYDMLRSRDEIIEWLYFNAEESRSYSYCTKFEHEHIITDLNATKTK